jgi:hypothetical protein
MIAKLWIHHDITCTTTKSTTQNAPKNKQFEMTKGDAVMVMMTTVNTNRFIFSK